MADLFHLRHSVPEAYDLLCERAYELFDHPDAIFESAKALLVGPRSFPLDTCTQLGLIPNELRVLEDEPPLGGPCGHIVPQLGEAIRIQLSHKAAEVVVP